MPDILKHETIAIIKDLLSELEAQLDYSTDFTTIDIINDGYDMLDKLEKEGE